MARGRFTSKVSPKPSPKSKRKARDRKKSRGELKHLIGTNAVVAAGFPHEFVSQVTLTLKTISEQFEETTGLAVAIRMGQKPRVDRKVPTVFKPMGIKTKTTTVKQGGNMGAGYLAIDQETFGRKGSKPLPDDIPHAQVRCSLREILNEYKSGNYAKFKVKGNKLIIRPKAEHQPEGKKIIYSIDLGTSTATVDHDPAQLTPWEDTTDIKKPRWWKSSMGSFAECLDKLFDVEYKPEKSAEMQPFLVAANEQGAVISGDADLLWTGAPNTIDDSYKMPYNSGEISQLKDLYSHFLALTNTNLRNTMKPEEFQSYMETVAKFIPQSGITTAFELIIATQCNQQFSEQDINHLGDLFRHGSECFNPGEPSPMDGDILHIWNGMPFVTNGERELVDYVMQDGFLEANFITIHPSWDMNIWSEVVERQIELGQPISDRLRENYDEYLGNRGQVKSAPRRKSIMSEVAQLEMTSNPPEYTTSSSTAQEENTEENKLGSPG